MKFSVTSPLLDACVLGLLSGEATYGYDLTQKVQNAIEISESTLYPVLRRLQKSEMLDTYDRSHNGRNRRYYRITDKGKAALSGHIDEWRIFRYNIESMLGVENDISGQIENRSGGRPYLPEPGE